MIEDITIDRERLYNLYMDNINYISDQCEEISSFTPKDIIRIISNIIELNPNLISKDNVYIR
jgi:hypothetical protein